MYALRECKLFLVRVSFHSPTEAEGRHWVRGRKKRKEKKKKISSLAGRGPDIVVDVYELLVLADRMHDCLVRDANL